jgi:hypothetical protein
MPTVPGEKFHIKCDVFRASGGYNGLIGFNGYDASGAYVNLSLNNMSMAFNASMTAGSWTTMEADVTVPANVVAVRAVVLHNSSGTDTGDYYFRGLTIRRRFGGELIVDGSIYANHVAANAIGTTKMVIGSADNLWPDPDFLDLAGNFAANSALAVNLNNSTSGGTLRALNINHTTGNYTTCSPLKPLDCIAGETFRLTAYCKGPVGVNSNIGFVVMWETETGAKTYSTVSFPTMGAWGTATASGQVTAPTGAVRFTPYLQCGPSAATGLYIFSRPAVVRAATGSLIVDGSIQAKHITADMVEGLLLSGRVIQTNTAANRGIKISDSGLVGYDSSGVASTVIDPVTGRITAVGSFNTAVGSDDIELRPGDGAGVTAAMRFINASGSRYRDSDPATLSLQTFGTTGNAWYLTLQGAMSTESTNRPQINIFTDNSTSGTTTTYITHQATLYHRFDIGNALIATVENTGIITPSGKGFFDQTYLNSAGAQAIINNNGRFTKSGSLRRLKRNIEDMTLEQARTLYELRPTTGQWIEDQDMGDAVWPFFIAEEVAETSGGDIWAAYNGQGEVTGVHYAEITVGLVALVRDLEARIQALESAA